MQDRRFVFVLALAILASIAVVIAADSMPQVGQLGETIAARNTFLVDPKGNIGNVWVKFEPNKHSEEVLAKLTEVAK